MERPHQADRICVRCLKGDNNTTNGLRRVTTLTANRVSSNLKLLMSIHTTQDLKHRLLEAGHPQVIVERWLTAIHQKPGNYADRLPEVFPGACIHKVCAMRVYVGAVVSLNHVVVHLHVCRSARTASPSCCALCGHQSESHWSCLTRH